jgi:hypothetical protein
MSVEQGLGFARYYPAPLTVRVVGSGTITRGFLGTTQRVAGKDYQLRATPAPGWIFSGWEGNVGTSEPHLTFTLGDDYELLARFDPSPYRAFEGAYLGYYAGADPLPAQPVLVKMQLTTEGAITGTITVMNQRLPFHGWLHPSFPFSTYLSLPKRSGQVGLSIAWDHNQQTITATTNLSRDDGQGWFTSVLLDGQLRSTLPEAEGRWNAISVRGPEDRDIRHAFFSTLVSRDLKVQMVGMTEDGKRFTGSTFFTTAGVAPFYSTVARSPAERTLSGVISTAFGSPDAMPAMMWDSSATSFYPMSEDHHRDLATTLHRWRVPSTAAGPWPMPRGTFNFWNAERPFTQRMSLGSSPVTHFVHPDSGTKVALMADPTTGLVRGYALPRSGPKLALQGIVTPEYIGGIFVRPDQTVGSFAIEPTR